MRYGCKKNQIKININRNSTNKISWQTEIDESKEKPKAYKDCAALAGIGIVVAAVVLPAAAVPGPAPGLAGPGSAAAAVAAPSTNCAAQRYP